MDDSGMAALGFILVCALGVVSFFAIVLLPVVLLVLALNNRRKAETPENKQAIDQKEQARQRLIEKGIVSGDKWC